jgi:ABC-type thiamine transport system ATPase subunit
VRDLGDGVAALDPSPYFSQRQDLALALFLTRARSLGGTFFLDEPASHLDDLNRVALLDIFRVLAAERGTDVSLVVTTASRALVRHLAEKLRAVPSPDGRPVLRIVRLSGNARLGVTAQVA